MATKKPLKKATPKKPHKPAAIELKMSVASVTPSWVQFTTQEPNPYLWNNAEGSVRIENITSSAHEFKDGDVYKIVITKV